MMKINALIVSLASLLLYLFAPMQFNYIYCMVCFFLFLINTYLNTKEDIKEKFYFSFNILFSFSFFLTTFAYPIFLKQIENIYLFGIQYINENLITKCTALAQLAFSIYTLAYVSIYSKNNKIKKRYPYIIFDKFNLYTNLLLAIILLCFLYEFLSIISDPIDENNFNSVVTPFLISIISIIFITKTFYKNYKSANVIHIFKKNKILFISVLLIILSLLYIGDRGIILNIILLLTATYIYYIKRIKLKYILPITFLAIIFMFLIGQTRNTEYSIKNKGISALFSQEKQSNYWNYFSDLTSISRNLYDGYEYTLYHKPLYPGKIIMIAVSPIPYFPTLFSELIYNKKFGELSSSTVLTNYSANKMNYDLRGGLGTHCVADIYMSWGLLGIIIFFALLGSSIAYSQKRLDSSIYSAFFYFIFLAFALYIPRSTLYVCFDIVGKCIILFILLNLIVTRK